MLIDEGTYPGVHMRCRVIGGLTLQVGDIEETKLLVVPESDHHADHIVDISDLPDAAVEELEAFFQAYRMLESKQVEVLDRQNRDVAIGVLTGQ